MEIVALIKHKLVFESYYRYIYYGNITGVCVSLTTLQINVRLPEQQ